MEQFVKQLGLGVEYKASWKTLTYDFIEVILG